ncbi:hypothetical protein KAR91_64345 [Candidatus Pacearchaeota archaeon]|nr:hypothetical protein [Candidatus Pacearchaeota archaeon]
MNSELLTTLAQLFNVDAGAVMGATLVIIFVLNAMKEHGFVKGKAILYWVGGLSILCGWAIGRPFFEAIFANAISIFLLTIGGWSTAKRLAKKMGKPAE